MIEVKLSNEELEQISGGASMQDTMYNLSYFSYRTVSVPAGTWLVMQESPGGAFLSTYYVDGETIFVNMRYSQAGYLMAYKNGVFGYVDSRYVR